MRRVKISRQTSSRAWLAIFFITTLLTVSSCEEDIWYAPSVEGTWRIVEVSPYQGYCPYYSGDNVEFSPSGEFYMWGSGYEEYGHWDYFDGALRVDFDLDGLDDWVGWLHQVDDHYMVLDVDDYSYGSTYTLRLTRY